MSILKQFVCFFVCMTTILLFFVKSKLRKILDFTLLKTLREFSDRSNLSYHICHLKSNSKLHAILTKKLLMIEIVVVCRAHLRQKQEIVINRYICYVRRKMTKMILTTKLNYHFNHVQLKKRVNVLIA